MSRSKKLMILLGVLLALCLLTFGISHIEVQKEKIRTGGEQLLSIPADTVTAVSWNSKTAPKELSFHKEESWIYDGDEAFPADPEKMNDLLEPFEDFRSAFVIDDAEDLSLYGLDDPEAVIRLTAGETEYQIELGDYSKMDQQRYVSLGDGKVYLVQHDPMEEFDAVLNDLILDDAVPKLDKATAIHFEGAQNYTLSVQKDGPSYRKNDSWFTETEDGTQPLDPAKVTSYLSQLSNLDLTSHITYNATAEELADCGLDAPELTITVDYPPEKGEEAKPFVLHLSRDPKERAKAEAKEESEDEMAEDITAYARVGESPIVYKLFGETYTTLIEASYNDLRYDAILPADFDTVSALDIALGDNVYHFTSKGSGEDRVWSWNETEISINEIQRTLSGLRADEFAEEQPADKLEVSVTAVLDLDGAPQVKVELYRKDGTHCIAAVNGSPVALVERSQAVELIEAINGIVLNEQAA